MGNLPDATEEGCLAKVTNLGLALSNVKGLIHRTDSRPLT